MQCGTKLETPDFNFLDFLCFQGQEREKVRIDEDEVKEKIESNKVNTRFAATETDLGKRNTEKVGSSG